MIFVTVGTHEQQFNRLVEYMDKWSAKHREDVVIQIGYSDYIPQTAKWDYFYSYKDMVEYIRNARIVVTHGGPSSFARALQFGKVPIVVPRRKEFLEHVNDHQTVFCKQLNDRYGNIILIEKIENLKQAIEQYSEIVDSMKNRMISNNECFCKEFEKIVDDLTD